MTVRSGGLWRRLLAVAAVAIFALLLAEEFIFGDEPFTVSRCCSSPSSWPCRLLLLKGFSHKEIARLRHTSTTTIRQQAASIYQKANLSGRAALSAFFLEDLLLPHQRRVREKGSAHADDAVSRDSSR
jgi:hypothetical protein